MKYVVQARELSMMSSFNPEPTEKENMNSESQWFNMNQLHETLTSAEQHAIELIKKRQVMPNEIRVVGICTLFSADVDVKTLDPDTLKGVDEHG